MTLAPGTGMRLAPFALLLVAGVAHGDDLPLLRLGARVAGGVNIDGAAANQWRVVPISAGVGGEHAILAQPWTTFAAEIFAEGPDVLRVGFAAGPRVYLADGSVRLGGGGTVVVVPATRVGATASMGGCFASEAPRLCADLVGTIFFAGEGLEDDTAGAQVKLVLDVGFDVL